MIPDPFLGRAVEIVVAREAQLDRAPDKGLADRVPVRNVGHAERAIGPVKSIGAARLVLGPLEIGQHVLE